MSDEDFINGWARKIGTIVTSPEWGFCGDEPFVLRRLVSDLIAEVHEHHQHAEPQTAGQIGISQLDHLRGRVADMEARLHRQRAGLTEEERGHLAEVREIVYRSYDRQDIQRTIDRLLSGAPRTVTAAKVERWAQDNWHPSGWDELDTALRLFLRDLGIEVTP